MERGELHYLGTSKGNGFLGTEPGYPDHVIPAGRGILIDIPQRGQESSQRYTGRTAKFLRMGR